MGASLLLDMAVLKSIAGRIRDIGLQRLTAFGVADQAAEGPGTAVLFPALLLRIQHRAVLALTLTE